MKKYLLFIAVFFSLNGFAQSRNIAPVTLMQQHQENFLKVIDSNAIFFIDNKNVIKYLKIAGKENGNNYSKLIKKLKGLCFPTVNLNKEIPDEEITMVQQLLRSEILVRAIQAGVVEVQPLGSKFSLPTANFIFSEPIAVENKMEQTFTLIDANGRTLFIGKKSTKK